MSVRVHKMIGWGLKGVRIRRGQFADPRILPMKDKGRDDDTVAAFLDFIAGNRDVIVGHLLPDATKKVGPERASAVASGELDGEVLLLKNHIGSKRPSNCVKSDEGHGPRQGVLLFRPLSQSEWFRWDDALDWIEETHFHWQKHRTRLLKTGPWPYDHWMVRFRDPPDALADEWRAKPETDLAGHWRVDGKGYASLSTGAWNQMVGRWDPRKTPPAAASPAWLAHFKDDFRPALPASVVALVLWSGMAKDPAGFLDALRPMIHVWWD